MFRKQTKNYSDEKIKHQSSEKFREKTYYEQNVKRYKFFSTLSYICQGLSIIFAFPYLVSVFTPLFPFAGVYIAFLVTGIALGGLEYFKRINGDSFIVSLVKNHYSTYPVEKIDGFVLGLIMVASIILSTLGIEHFSRFMADKSELIASEYGHKKDSIETHYNALIETVNSNEKSYKSSVTYKGRIDMSNTTNKQKFSEFSTEKTALKGEKRDALSELKNEEKGAQGDNESDTNKKVNTMIVVALINETMLIYSLYSVFFFLGRLYVEQLEDGEINSAIQSATPNPQPPQPKRKKKHKLFEFETQTETAKQFETIGSQEFKHNSPKHETQLETIDVSSSNDEDLNNMTSEQLIDEKVKSEGSYRAYKSRLKKCKKEAVDTNLDGMRRALDRIGKIEKLLKND